MSSSGVGGCWFSDWDLAEKTLFEGVEEEDLPKTDLVNEHMDLTPFIFRKRCDYVLWNVVFNPLLSNPLYYIDEEDDEQYQDGHDEE